MRQAKYFMIGLVAALIVTQFSYTVSVAQEFKTHPLSSFLSSKGYRLYKIGTTLPPGLADGPWKNEGVVGYVLKDPAPGSHPVYSYLKSDQWGTRYSYNRRDDQSGSGWNLQGIAFHVPPQGTPGTVRLFKLYAPAKETNPGKAFTGMVPGTDAIFLTTDTARREEAIAAGWQGAGVVGYVWTTPPQPPAQPDLVVKQTSVEGKQIRALIANQGKTSVSSAPGVQAAVYIYDAAGKVVFTKGESLGGMSSGQSRPVVFDVGNFPIAHKRYKVLVDPSSLVSESDDNNNETAILNFPSPKIKINPLPPDYVSPPTFTLTAITPSPTSAQPTRTIYRLLVTNWERFNADWFTSLENVLPPNSCGGGNSYARLLTRFIVIKNGSPVNAACKPLNAHQDLRTVEFAVPSPLSETDKIKIAVVDTVPGGRTYESQTYPVGLFGVAKVLTTSGCKFLLGRESSYVCSTDQGFSMCEGLRTKGKPIECHRVGNK
jgi:hypothetical protein